MVKYIKYDFSNWFYRFFNGKIQIPSGTSGVYIFVDVKTIGKNVNYLPLYIGSTRSLRSRLSSHEIYRELIKNFNRVDCYFLYTRDYSIKEVFLINELKPIFNFQFNEANYLKHG